MLEVGCGLMLEVGCGLMLEVVCGLMLEGGCGLMLEVWCGQMLMVGCGLMLEVGCGLMLEVGCEQALAGEVGMSVELDDVARSLFNGTIPAIWKRLSPETLKSLGNWMVHFEKRFHQYQTWVSRSYFSLCAAFIHCTHSLPVYWSSWLTKSPKCAIFRQWRFPIDPREADVIHGLCP